MPSLSPFENLPDEIILHICQYLRGADVLYSFYNLNTRLNVTITGYCHYVNLMAVSYKQFEYAASYVLPKIGYLVQTFVLNGNWETIINDRISSVLFASRLAILFPHLRRLTIKWFTSERFLLFVDTLRDFPQLVELDIRFLKGNTIDLLLSKVLSANNGQLQIVSFDQDSVDLDISKDDTTTSHSNIQELTVNLSLSKLIPNLFLLVPYVCRLYVSVEQLSNTTKFKPAIMNLTPLIHLIAFQLRSINLFWTFEEISQILEAMPFLQRLALDFRTDDKRLVTEEDLITILPLTLTKMDFFIRYYFSETIPATEVSKTFSSVHYPIAYLLDEPRTRFFIHTIPCDLHSAILTATISKQMSTGWKYMQQTEDLYIYDITSLIDVLLILQHFRRVRTLSIDAKNKTEVLTLPVQSQSIDIKLPLLKQIEISGICELHPLLNAARNVDYIIVYFDCLKTLFDNESTCHLLQTRITRLNVIDWVDVKSNLLQRISEIFCSLRHLVITLKDPNILIDDFVLTILSLWQGKTRLSLDVKGSLLEETIQDIRQWIVNHSYIKAEDSFAVEYNDKWFDLWF